MNRTELDGGRTVTGTKRFVVAVVALFVLAGCTAAQRMALAHRHASRPAITQVATSNSVDIPRVVEPDAGPVTVTQNGVTVTANCTSIRFTGSGFTGASQAGIGVGGGPPTSIHIVGGGFDVTLPVSSSDLKWGSPYLSVLVDGAMIFQSQKIGMGC